MAWLLHQRRLYLLWRRSQHHTHQFSNPRSTHIQKENLMRKSIYTLLSALSVLFFACSTLAFLPATIPSTSVDFKRGYTVAMNLHGQMALQDSAGNKVTDWMTITPDNGVIPVKNGEVRIIYHLLGGKFKDFAWHWSYYENDIFQFSGDFDYGQPKK